MLLEIFLKVLYVGEPFAYHHFNCDSLGVVYLITCMKFDKQYVGSTVTAFRKRFNNHKSSLIRYGKGQKEICGKHLYSHFYTEGHSGIKDFSVQVIDVTDVNNPTERETFWIEKLRLVNRVARLHA